MRKSFFLKNFFLLILILVMLLAGCSSSGGTSSTSNNTGDGNQQNTENEANANETIKVGAIYPLTGPLALLGQESFRGVEVAVDKWNQQGGINGKQIELIPVDTPSANEAMASAQKLVQQEGVDIVVGSFESSLVPIAAQITERNKIPYFELGSVADDITEQGFKYLFRFNPPSYMYAQSDINFIKYLAEKVGRPVESFKVGVIHEDSNWGTSIKDDFIKEAEKVNIKDVKVVSYNMATVKSVDSQILALKEFGADVVIGVSYIDDSILVVRTMEKLNFRPLAFIGQGGGYSLPNLKESVGSAVNGLFNIDFTQYRVNPETTPGLQEYVELYKQKYGEPPLSGHSLTNYFGAEQTFSILKAAKSLDGDDIREAAMAYEVAEGTTSTGWGVKFNEKGQNILSPPFAMQYQNSELETVWPEKQKSADIILNQ